MGVLRDVHEVVFERRILAIVTAVAAAGSLAFLVAVATDFWLIAIETAGTAVENNGHAKPWAHYGMWRSCVVDSAASAAAAKECARRTDDEGFRAMASLCVVVLLLIALAVGFSVYSLVHPRYTFKRLSAALHFMTALTVVLLTELTKDFVQRRERSDATAEGAEDRWTVYGFSYLLSWVSFLLFLLSAVSFATASRKRKHLPYDSEHNLK